MSEPRPQKFRKLPVVIEAMQFENTDESSHTIEGWAAPNASWFYTTDGKRQLAIRTLEGTHYASPGDWIIKGVKGEFYPCKPDIFARTYERAEAAALAAARRGAEQEQESPAYIKDWASHWFDENSSSFHLANGHYAVAVPEARSADLARRITELVEKVGHADRTALAAAAKSALKVEQQRRAAAEERGKRAIADEEFEWTRACENEAALAAEQAAHAETRGALEWKQKWWPHWVAKALGIQADEMGRTPSMAYHAIMRALKVEQEAHAATRQALKDEAALRAAERYSDALAREVEQEARQRAVREEVERLQRAVCGESTITYQGMTWWLRHADVQGIFAERLAALDAPSNSASPTPEAQRTSAPIGSPLGAAEAADTIIRLQRSAAAGPQGAETGEERP